MSNFHENYTLLTPTGGATHLLNICLNLQPYSTLTEVILMIYMVMIVRSVIWKCYETVRYGCVKEMLGNYHQDSACVIWWKLTVWLISMNNYTNQLNSCILQETMKHSKKVCSKTTIKVLFNSINVRKRAVKKNNYVIY